LVRRAQSPTFSFVLFLSFVNLQALFDLIVFAIQQYFIIYNFFINYIERFTKVKIKHRIMNTIITHVGFLPVYIVHLSLTPR